MFDLTAMGQFKEEVVELEELGASVLMREMSGLERLTFEEHWSSLGGKGPDAIRRMATLLVFSIINPETGDRKYGVADVDLIVKAQPVRIIHQLFNVATKLNDMDKEKVERLAGN